MVSRRQVVKGLTGILASAGAAPLFTACSQTKPPKPSYACLSTSAEDYAASLGLTLNPHLLQRLDETESCFTQEEAAFLDLLAYAAQQGTPVKNLENILQAFPTIGPATVQALAWSLIAYENDKVENPSLPPFSLQDIGIFPLLHPRSVSTITVNGKTYTLPTLLETYGLPSRYADPSINPDIQPAVPYQPYPDADVFSFPDLKNTIPGETLTELDLWTGIRGTQSEDARITSYDITIFRKESVVNGKPVYPVLQRRVWLITPGPARVVSLARDESFATRNDNGIVPHYLYEIVLEYNPDPRDYPLFGADVQAFWYHYVHIVPDITNPFATEDAFPYKEGDTLPPGAFIGNISPWMGPAFELDFNITEPPSREVLAKKFPLPSLPSGMLYGGTIIPVLLGKLYEKGVPSFTPPSTYPHGYRFLRPPGPRFNDPRVFRPATGYWDEDGYWHWKNEP